MNHGSIRPVMLSARQKHIAADSSPPLKLCKLLATRMHLVAELLKRAREEKEGKRKSNSLVRRLIERANRTITFHTITTSKLLLVLKICNKHSKLKRQTTHRAIHRYSRVPDSSYTAKSHTAEAILSVIVTEKLPLEMDVNKCYDTNIGQDKKFRLSVGTSALAISSPIRSLFQLLYYFYLIFLHELSTDLVHATLLWDNKPSSGIQPSSS